MKTNRKVTIRRNSDKSQKRKDGNQKTMPRPSAAEHDQTEEKLLASEVRYRRLFESAKDGILILDGDTGEIVDVNPFLMEMLGYSLTEFLGKQLWGIGLFKDIVANKDSFLKLQEERYIRYENLPLETKDGRTIWVEFVSNVYHVNGKQVIQCNIRNITDRKRVEEALAKEQREMQTLMNYLPVEIYFKDRASRFTRISKSQAVSFGLSDPAQAIGKTDFDFFTMEHARQAYEDEQAIIQTGQPLIKEEKETWADRPNVWVSTIKMPIRDNEGNIIGTFGISTDITERKRAEEAVVEERNLLLTLINNLPDRIYVKDIQGRKMISNTADWQALGEKRMEDVIGKTDFDTYPAELATRFWADDKMVLDSGKPVINREESSLDWQDNLIWTLTTKVPLRDDNGQIVGLVGIGRDFTERKQVEERLRENEAMYRLLFDSAPVGILLVDIQGNILEVNPAALQILGSPSAEATKNINILTFQPLIEAGISADFQKVMDNAQSAITEYLYTTKWGKSVFITLRFTPLFGANGNLEQIQVIMEDTTERKQAEKKIQQQLHRLSALRDIDLVINSNFDLKVTLNILLGHVTAQLGVDAAAVLLFHQSMNQLEFAAGQGFHTANITHLRLKLGEGYPGKAALERRTIAIYNLAKSPEPFGNRFIEGEDFATFFAVPLIAKGKVKGVLEVFHRSPFKTDADWLNFLEALAGQTAIAIDNSELFGNLQQSNLELQLAYDKTIEGWSRALDLRDKETEGHTQRVTKTALRLAGAMGLGNDKLIQVRRGALLHDIGKMGVPDHILFKPGALTGEEWVVIKEHPQFAFDLISPIDFLRPALDIPYGHHEKWDGTGYPRGLKGEQIPLTARIFAVVDVYDALTSDRPYRLAWTKEKALEYIQSEAGKYFDPNIVQEFIEVIKKD